MCLESKSYLGLSVTKGKVIIYFWDGVGNGGNLITLDKRKLIVWNQQVEFFGWWFTMKYLHRNKVDTYIKFSLNFKVATVIYSPWRIKVPKSQAVEDLPPASKNDAIPSLTFMKTLVTEISKL